MYKLIEKDGKEYLPEQKGQFGRHRILKIYGKLDCPSALRYIAAGYYIPHRVFFADEETALTAGYRPCGICEWGEKAGLHLKDKSFMTHNRCG